MKTKQQFKNKILNKNSSINDLVSDTVTKQEVLEKNNLIRPTLVLNRSEFQKSEEDKTKLKALRKTSNNLDGKSYMAFEVWKYINKVNYVRERTTR